MSRRFSMRPWRHSVSMLLVIASLYALDGCDADRRSTAIEAPLSVDVVRAVLRNRADLCEPGFEQVCIAVTPLPSRTPPFDVGVPKRYCVTTATIAVNTVEKAHCTIPLRFASDASRFVLYGYQNPDWHTFGTVETAQQHQWQGNPVVALASLRNVRIGSIRYPVERPGIAVVEWTAELSFSPTYRRWFAGVAPGTNVQLDALRFHVGHGIGRRQSSFIRRDGFWFYSADRTTTRTPDTTVWDRQASELQWIAIGSCVLLFAISLGGIVFNEYVRRVATITRRILNPGFGRLFFVSTCILLGGVSRYWDTHVDMRSGEPILHDVLGLPGECVLAWGELDPPCNYTIAKALGFRGSDQAIFINIDYFWPPPPLPKYPVEPLQCAPWRVDHVGNGMTAFVLSNRHLYYTYAIYQEALGAEAPLIRMIHTGAIVSSCLDAQEKQYLKVGGGFVHVVQLWR